MSIHTQSRFSLVAPPPQLAVDADMPDFRLPRNYVYSSNLSIPVHTTEGGHLCTEEHSTPEYANACTTRSTFAHVNQHTQLNPTLWGSTLMAMVPESSATISSLLVAKDMHDDDIISASQPAYDPGSYSAQWDNHVVIEPSYTLRPNPSSIHLHPHPILQYIHDSGDRLRDELSAYRSISHARYPHYPRAESDQNVADSFTPHDLTSHQTCSPPLPHCYLRTASSGYREPDSSFRFMPPQDPTVSSRRRGARAIEYGGLWIDEDELLGGLTEPNRMLYVHRCLWEEDRSPCHLWIKSDKSCINAHIQKWHRGRPGGDKLEAECRWSACGKRMLKESIARHILSIHLGELWGCRGCGKGIARKDAYGRHVVKAEFEGCRTAGALITYSAEVRVIDSRAALDSGGRMRYADA